MGFPRGVAAVLRRVSPRVVPKAGATRVRAIAARLGRAVAEPAAGAVAVVLRGAEAARRTTVVGLGVVRDAIVARAWVLASVALLCVGLLVAAAGTRAFLSLATAACLVGGGWLAWRRLASGEHRESLDLDEMLAAGFGWSEDDDEPVDGPTWSASGEAGVSVVPVDDAPVEVLDLTVLAVHDRRDRPEPVVASGEWCPDRPLPGEPDEPVSSPSFGGRAGELPIAGYVPDAYATLLERRDAVAEQVAEAFADLHRMRTETLRRAAQAEHNAELATSARNRAARIVRDTRRQQHHGRERPDEFPDSDDAFDDVHRFRTEALRQAAQAEHGAEGVARARERANRLLAEQRKIEVELRKIAPRRFVG